MTLERSSSWWSRDLALRDFKFKEKRGWRSNEHVRTGEAMNIDFLLMMKKNDGHSAGISVQQTNKFYFPIVHPMVPIGNLSTTVDQHLGEPAKHRHRDVEVSSKILGERLGIFVAGACFFHIQFVDSKEEINVEKLASVESSWKSARETPFPKSSLPHLIVNGIKKGTLIPDLSAHFSAIFGRTRWDV